MSGLFLQNEFLGQAVFVCEIEKGGLQQFLKTSSPHELQLHENAVFCGMSEITNIKRDFL